MRNIFSDVGVGNGIKAIIVGQNYIELGVGVFCNVYGIVFGLCPTESNGSGI